MAAFILRRLAQALFVIGAMLVIVFFGVNVVGDPIYMLVSPEMNQEQIAETARSLGLDRPIWEQFLIFLRNAVQGDLGRSFVHGESAIKLILSRMPATLELALVALFMAIVIGLPLGLYAGLKPESKASRAIMAISILGFSLPTFWVGLMLILAFAVGLGWLPATGRGETVSVLGIETSLLTVDGWQHVALPALNLALLKISLVIRLARAGAREAALMDYVKFARAKGLSQSRIIGVHILKNIMIPIVTVLGLEFGSLVAFSVVTETIFAWPGMGRLLLEAITRLDRPVIVAYVMVVVVLFVTINLLVDLVYSALDPRVRLTEAST
ncbi:putative oligopeptide ABC transporter (Permease protein) [Bosea sp. LC85]|uniref:ABC transporter permease n=1 Tax=Bosea sp. LC85 TaxID=1502851 RepID=UPI0004E2F168|nr:ABC transporter permease [Bosea sp. LC85]KFC64101.1 putative oligopeptide ABC transporter (Permease protein) [Bosea sp. LC85]